MKYDINYTASVLHGISPFDALSSQEVSQLARNCGARTVKKGTMLFHEGGIAASVYVFASGSLQLVKTALNGREVVVKTMDHPEIFAEVILFGADRFPVSAVALADSIVIEVHVPVMREWLQNAVFRDALFRLLMSKQVFLTQRLMYYMCNDVEERLYHYLRERFPGQKRIELDISKKDLAAAIGTVPETLSRLFKRLEKEGAMERDGSTLLLDTRT